jgi:phage/plasmid-associated DNA primase
MNETTIFSIGHGNKKIEDFIKELKTFEVQFLLDIRSKPFSKWNPQFNQNELKFKLEENGIKYVLSGNMMKKVSSGGDTLTGRLHKDNETHFIPHYNVFCNANDLPDIKPYDAAIDERLNIISYNKKYVDEPSNEYELKKDSNIDIEMRSENFINAFQNILFNVYLEFYKNNSKEYIPEAVKNCKTEWVGEDSNNNCINKFLENFEITNDNNDFIKSNEIEYFIKENNLSISITKFMISFKKYCNIKKYNNVESKIKKIGGKSIRGWIGIKKIDNNDDDDDQNPLDL